MCVDMRGNSCHSGGLSKISERKEHFWAQHSVKGFSSPQPSLLPSDKFLGYDFPGERQKALGWREVHSCVIFQEVVVPQDNRSQEMREAACLSLGISLYCQVCVCDVCVLKVC